MTEKGNSILNVKDLSFINEIKSVAVIGTSQKRNFLFLRNHQANFKGPVYAINPSIEDIPNFPKDNIFASITDVPGSVDFAFIAVPASRVLDVIKGCVTKGVKLATVFTAEFSDSGTEEGRELEKKLLTIADNRVRLLGPNGMGLFYPKIGIAWRAKFPSTPGNIGLISQSGGMSNIAIYSAEQMGLHFSKVFSFGNGTDIDFVDLLHFLINDLETEIIICYIEGIKYQRGKDLLKVLSLNKKTIIFLRGGTSNRGAGAAKTHTASISGEDQIWRSIIKQHNLMEVDSLEQLLHMARFIDCYGIKKIKNLAVLSVSGGYGVILTDLLQKYGMDVPPFSSKIQKEISETFFIRGTSSKNPLDVSGQRRYSESIHKIIDLALSDDQIDGVLMDFPGWYFNYDISRYRDKDYESKIIDVFSLGHKHDKPLILVIQSANSPDDTTRISQILAEKNIPVFSDPLEIIPLLPKISNYRKKLNRKG